jgi:hypothetical protein
LWGCIEQASGSVPFSQSPHLLIPKENNIHILWNRTLVGQYTYVIGARQRKRHSLPKPLSATLPVILHLKRNDRGTLIFWTSELKSTRRDGHDTTDYGYFGVLEHRRWRVKRLEVETCGRSQERHH